MNEKAHCLENPLGIVAGETINATGTASSTTNCVVVVVFELIFTSLVRLLIKF